MGEKYPELTKGKSFLFGLVYLPMYAYYDGLTSAQVELLTMDAPVVDYHADKKKKTELRAPTKEEADAVAEKWKKKYEGKKLSGTLDLTKYE